MNLPKDKELPVSLLAGVFNKTTATYKFYWFISLLELLNEREKNIIPIKDILARMICNSWYPVNYFRISFGFFDMFSSNIKEIMELTKAPRDIKKEELFDLLIRNQNKQVISLINHFDKQVPYRFLSPWFPGKSNQEIVKLSQNFSKDCLYRIFDKNPKDIEINPGWCNYLIKNQRIILDFCYWNLALYLQVKNPNVPDIPNKLIKPITRAPLFKPRKYWMEIFSEVKGVKCIYTNLELDKENFSVEHFIPYSFVSHDLLWNLIPVNSRINISKSNKLPALTHYLGRFTNLQQMALRVAYYKNPNNKLLEDYQILGAGISDLINLSTEDFNKRYYNILSPLVQIAENMGFEYWDQKPETL